MGREIKQTGEERERDVRKGQTKQGATTWAMGGTDIHDRRSTTVLIIIINKCLVECNLAIYDRSMATRTYKLKWENPSLTFWLPHPREKNAIHSFPRWNCGIDGHLDTEGNAIWPNKLKRYLKEAQTKGQFKFPVMPESHRDSNWL